MRRRINLPSRRRVVPVAAALAILVGAAGFWLRDSGFFAVERVEVAGASGPDAPKIESALRDVARDMTTLHVKKDKLMQAVEPYPTVDDVKVDAQLAHGLKITVLE